MHKNSAMRARHNHTIISGICTVGLHKLQQAKNTIQLTKERLQEGNRTHMCTNTAGKRAATTGSRLGSHRRKQHTDPSGQLQLPDAGL